MRRGIVPTAFAVAFSGAAAPGPMLVMVIGQALAQGLASTVFILVGHAVLELLVLGLLAGGLARPLAKAWVRTALGSAGGLMLLYLGCRLLLDLDTVGLTGVAGRPGLPWYSLVLGGMAVSLSNPYFAGWWLTVGTGLIASLRLQTLRDWLTFWVAHEAGDVGWYVPVALLVVASGRFLNDTAYRGVLAVCGVFLVLLGAIFLVMAARAVMAGRTAVTAIPILKTEP